MSEDMISYEFYLVFTEKGDVRVLDSPAPENN